MLALQQHLLHARSCLTHLKWHLFTRFERSYGKFQRRFVLPEHVDTAGVTAEVKNGVLQVTVPKKESSKRELTNIPVQEGSAAASSNIPSSA